MEFYNVIRSGYRVDFYKDGQFAGTQEVKNKYRPYNYFRQSRFIKLKSLKNTCHETDSRVVDINGGMYKMWITTNGNIYIYISSNISVSKTLT